MRIEPFGVEQWMTDYETRCRHNLAESCVESLTVNQLLAIAGVEDLGALLGPMKLTYGEINGSDRLRRAVTGLYARQEPENVLVMHGAVGANHLAHTTLVEPGDRVVSVMPTYQQHYSLPESLGANVQVLELQESDGWLPDLGRLEDLVAGDAKLVALNNPNNPTGSLMDRAFLERVVQICDQAGAWLLCDEAYRGVDQAEPGITASVADLYERGVATASMSKPFSLAGLRLGWVVAPTDLVREMTVHRDYSTISVGMIDDLLAALALENADAILARSREIVRDNLALVEQWVAGEPLVSWVKPQGGTTAFLKYHVDLPSRDFCIQLLDETGVMLSPGSAFGVEQHLRMGFANNLEEMKIGLPLISEFLHSR